MKKSFLKVISYLVVICINFCFLDNIILFAAAGNDMIFGETGDDKHYQEDGTPIVRRQVFPESKEDKASSSLRKAIGQKREKEKQSKELPPKINMNNIVIFVRFQGEKEYITDQNRTLFINHYNGKDVSLRSYMKDISYGQFDVLSDFFPVNSEDESFYSYEAKNPREYYQPFSGKNPQGYKNKETANNREFELLSEAISYCRPMIEKRYSNPVSLDFNEDGKIDNVIFIVSGKEDTWDDMLWPHQFAIPKKYQEARIHDKRVHLYNFMLQSCFRENSVGTSSHEFLHTKGFPDFYRYKAKGEPVGSWDLMSIQKSIPQFPLVYPRYKYGAFCNKPDKITHGGKYELNPTTTPDYRQNIAYILTSPHTKSAEYFIIEYRAPAKYEPGRGSFDCNYEAELEIQDSIDISKEEFSKDIKKSSAHWDQYLPGEGIIVYRVNKDVVKGRTKGNAFSDGYNTPDNIFVFRKGITEPHCADGDIKEGALLKTGDSLGVIDSYQVTPRQSRRSKRLSKVNLPKTEDMIYFFDGENSGIRIYDINIDDQEKIASFRVEFDNTFITKFVLDKAKEVKIDFYNKRILIELSPKYQHTFILPQQIEHNGCSITPDYLLGQGIPISDEMQYVVKSPTGIEQVWEIVVSPLCKSSLEEQSKVNSRQIIMSADLFNKKGVKYQWYCDGVLLPEQSTEQLILDRPKDSNAHEFYFIASNDAGSFKSDVVIAFGDGKIKQKQGFLGFLTNIFSPKTPRRKMSDVTPRVKYKGTYCKSESDLLNSNRRNCNSADENINDILYKISDVDSESETHDKPITKVTEENSYISESKDAEMSVGTLREETLCIIYDEEKNSQSGDIFEKEVKDSEEQEEKEQSDELTVSMLKVQLDKEADGSKIKKQMECVSESCTTYKKQTKVRISANFDDINDIILESQEKPEEIEEPEILVQEDQDHAIDKETKISDQEDQNQDHD